MELQLYNHCKYFTQSFCSFELCSQWNQSFKRLSLFSDKTNIISYHPPASKKMTAKGNGREKRKKGTKFQGKKFQ